MPRAIYSLLYAITLPLMLLRLSLRSRREQTLRRALGERFGRGPGATAELTGVLWVHAVSLGELNAITPVLQALLETDGAPPVLLTVTSAAGRSRAEAVFAGRVHIAWLPFDLGTTLTPFLDRWRPRVLVLVETELWPNLVEHCRRREIPVVLANARLSARSAAGYRRVAPLLRPTFAALAAVLCQDDATRARFEALGTPARRLTVPGSLKFEPVPPAQAAADDVMGVAVEGLAARLRGTAPLLLVAGSTHDGEEAQLVEALAPLLRDGRLRLVVVPRQPRRFDAAWAALRRAARAAGVEAVRDTSCGGAGALPAQPAVVLFDRMGQLFEVYGAADLAFVGGSLTESAGGHNPIEPAWHGVPVLMGVGDANFRTVVAALEDAGALLKCADAMALADHVARLTEDSAERAQRGDAARRVVAAQVGARAATVTAILGVLG